MAALDFPASPTVGQKYPSPAVTGVPVYTWDGEKWTTLGGALGSTGASDAIPQPDTGTGAAGSSTLWSRGDHAHPLPPTDLTRAPIASPTFTGDPKAPTPAAGDSDTSLATTAFVSNAVTTAVGGIPGAPSAVVRYDIAQSLTAPQLIQARQNIYAAPFDAMAYSGLQINGAMDVSQEKGASVTSTVAYICDGWKLGFGGTMVVGASAGGPGAFAGVGFSNNIGLSVSTAQASLGAGDYVNIQQPVEGWRIARLGWGAVNAQPITIGFWSSHHRPGLYSGSVRNGATNRSYAFTYTQAAADVPQYNTVTIPGDTSGTWSIDNTTGTILTFSVGAGSTYTAPSANAWVAGNYQAAPGQINGIAATSDIFRITGVIILPGNEAPSAARSQFVMRPYSQELELCRRYYSKRLISFIGNSFQAAGTFGVWIAHLVQMRAAPTVAAAGGTFANASGNNTDFIDADGYRRFISATTAGNCGVTGSVETADARL
jgi:hypothetical protein